jgi:hypothetical protein
MSCQLNEVFQKARAAASGVCSAIAEPSFCSGLPGCSEGSWQAEARESSLGPRRFVVGVRTELRFQLPKRLSR